jgi:putative membrane protein (TIGR04086 family)
LQRSFFSAVLYGWIVIIIILLLASLVLALIIRFLNMTEISVSYISLIIGFITLLIGGLVAGIKGKENGLMIGLFTGIGFTILTFIVQYLGYDTVFSVKQSLYHLGYIICAVLGSIIGVNFASQKN